MHDFNNADYLEQTIKCLFLDKRTLHRAIEVGLTPQDFGTIGIYQVYVATALAVGNAPISSDFCLTMVRARCAEFNVSPADLPQVVDFWEYIYAPADNQDSTSELIRTRLIDFIKFRRYQTIKVEEAESPEALLQAAEKLVEGIDLKSKGGAARECTPFEELITVEHQDSILTGFDAIDQATRGLGLQEFGILLGHSGSGKTAMGVYMALQNALMGHNVLYLSLEEPMENISQRVYSNIFRIPYTDLHKGNALQKAELKEAFPNLDPVLKGKLANLKIHDLRDATPLTCKFLKNYLDELYTRTGWHPTIVYIDQMDYLTTSDKFEKEWEKYGKVAFEVDNLSNHLIGGEHMFSVWLMHQAGGKMVRKFSNAEISGFKGVIKPADMALAIGRDSAQDQIVSIFSLKSRHAKNFQFNYLAELEFMNFEEAGHADTDKVAEEKKEKKTLTKSNFANIPPRPKLEVSNPGLAVAGTGMLPPPGGGFK